MPQVRPFIGLLYDTDVVGSIADVTAPPYDTISPIDRDRYHRASPHNIVRLILGRDEPGDDETNTKYTRAATYLRSWQEDGVLTPTPRPSYFPYEFRFHHGGVERRVRGLIAEVDLEPWGGSILRHERTMPGPLEDRLELLRTVPANLSPVHVIAGGPSAQLGHYLDESMSRPPDQEMTDGVGTTHRLWVADGSPVVGAALREETFLIADGHHRYTVALAYREEMRTGFGPGPWDAMMMLVVDGAAEDPPVLPIHRLALGTVPAHGRPGERVRDMAEVLASVSDEHLTYGTVELEGGELVHRVSRLEGRPPTVCELHDRVLDRVPGIELRFVPDAVAVEQAVLAGSAPVGFILPPTHVDRVRSVIARGGVLPQKSTYFWPKPRTGFVLRPFRPDR